MQNHSNILHGTTATTCYFGHRESFVEFFPGMLELQNPHHNQAVAQAGDRQKRQAAGTESDPTTLASLCYYYLAPLLDKPGLNLAAAAETMGVAERTLRRKAGQRGDFVSGDSGTGQKGYMPALFPGKHTVADRNFCQTGL